MNDEIKMTDEHVWFEAWKQVRLMDCAPNGLTTMEYADEVLREFRKRFPKNNETRLTP